MRLGVTTFPHPPGTPQREVFAHGIRRASELGASVLNSPLPTGTADDLEWLRDKLASAELELEPTCGGNLCSTGDQASAVRDRMAAALTMAHALGCPRLRTMAARATNRFTKSPPLAEQLDIITANLREVVAVAEELRVVLALENHCDYHGSEIAELVRRIGSPYLGAALDTGNAYTVFEDPIDAAEAMAPVTVTTHLKDFRIEPLGLAGKVPWVPVGCALGEGNVDLPAIVGLLARRAPSPDRLPLIVEVDWPPAGQDVGELIVQSVSYLKGRFTDSWARGEG